MTDRAKPAATHHHAASADTAFFYAFAVFLLAAPVYYASVGALPRMLLELAAIGFLYATLVTNRDPLRLPRTLVAGLAILLAWPLIQLLPLPEAWWRALPGRGEYVAALDRFAAEVVRQGNIGVRHTISVVPTATEEGWLALLPPLACLLAGMRMRERQVPKLLLFMIVFAGVEGLLGLMQVGAGSGSAFEPRTGTGLGVASGTFVNKNHLAGLLAMTLPVVIGMIVYRIRHERDHGRAARTFNSNLFAQRALLFVSAAMILLALFFTVSRAGIGTALVGLACTGVLLTRSRESAWQARSLALGVLGLGLALAFAIGLTPVLERLDPEPLRVSAEDRTAMSVATAHAAIEFLPLGSGLSTLVAVFPRFQPETMAGLVDYAHNDYAQAFLELGLAAPVIVALLLAAYCLRMVELLRHKGAHSLTVLQLAAGIGLLPMILHSLFDFGLHMPAVGMWFATLAGVMFRPGSDTQLATPGR